MERPSNMVPENKESQEKEKYGTNITIRNFWIRHAQKMSGEVMDIAGTAISSSSISPSGEQKSIEYGRNIKASERGAKGYVSTVKRTTETLEKILEGYRIANPNMPLRKIRIREVLSSHEPERFLTLYNSKFSQEKNRILQELGKTPDEFSKLSPDEQEHIAETIGEPIISEWLDNPESDLAKLYSSRIAAACFAVLFCKRHGQLAQKLFSGSEIDLFHVTHKTITEPFLVSGVLIRKSDGQRITKLQEIGGSLNTLGNWESITTLDEHGKENTIVKLRGGEYVLDAETLKDLYHEGMLAHKAETNE